MIHMMEEERGACCQELLALEEVLWWVVDRVDWTGSSVSDDGDLWLNVFDI